jgi:hypothetical protein
MTGQFAVQRMKIPPWKIHSDGATGAVQDCHLIFQFPCVCRIDACLRAVIEEPFKPCVSERLDHPYTVSPLDTTVNRKSCLSRSGAEPECAANPALCSKKEQLKYFRPAENRECADKSQRIQCAVAQKG